MTACVNKKHSRRVAAAVSASLVGALTLGAAPVLAVAEEAPVTNEWITPTGAFENATVVKAVVKRGAAEYKPNTDGVISIPFVENQPVVFDHFQIDLMGTAIESDDFRVDPDWDEDQFEVAFYHRDSKGDKTGDEIKNDLTAPGQYCAVITGVEGSHYTPGELIIPIDITAANVKTVTVNKTSLFYDATVHNDEFEFEFDGNPVTEGVDYEVEYVVDGHDTLDAVDVKDARTYKAVLTGIGAYAGAKVTSPAITVKPLDVSAPGIIREGLAATGDDEIENILAIWINGRRFTGDDAIMSELKADIDTATSGSGDYAGTVWMNNGKYRYTLHKKDASDGNITGDTAGFDAYKVKYLADFQYAGEAWPVAGWETVLADKDTVWASGNVTAHADNDLEGGVDLAYPADIEKYRVVDEDGTLVDGYNMSPAYDWGHKPGTYTVNYRVTPKEMEDNGYVYGGQAVTTVKVYTEAVDADAKAAVFFNADGDSGKEVVTSIETPYVANRNLKDEIEVVVLDSNGTNLVPDKATVKYYDSEGREVKGALTDAGTYTLKVTSHDYKLTGTTEMTITITPVSVNDVKSDALMPLKFDDTSNHGDYLRWDAEGTTITELKLQYKDAKGKWVNLPMDVYKVTIVNEDGEEVKKITDEGVYTLKFENRNADAANNYPALADLTVTCIKDGKSGDEGDVDHTLFSDVTYRDYFADPVAWVNNKRFMTGYDRTRVFGAYDSLTRGQVACVLYNMAVDWHKVDDSSLKYNELFGYETGFSDVNGKAYYGKAIAWAAQAGVVNGYQDGTFHPDQAVSRQEFACMLANYAKAYGTFEAAGSDALDKMSDAEQVADFAVDSVAWAVENGILGNSGYVAAGSTIIRADAACMVYNYAK